MTFVEIILLSVSLCVDTFVVSIGGSVTMEKSRMARIFPVALTFGVMQAALLFIGWVLGHSIVSYIDSFSRIVGFVLLLYIGIMMIVNALGKDCNGPANLSGVKSLFLAAVATSVDASAVGVSLAMAEISLEEMYMSVGSVFAVTVLAALCGMIGGRYIGDRFGKPSYIAGGTVLILIGLRILLA
ncbi:MAG: manganese efflux pump MntP family protein [Bacteroidales bacterium]|nr:manganese efflux pump MntP family protein [Bacteroidales bacterium]